MKIKNLTLLSVCLVLMSASAGAAPTKESKQVRDIITKVNDHWQATNSPETRAFWDNAAYHTGNMEAYFLMGNDAWRDYSERWAEHNERPKEQRSQQVEV